MGIKHYTLDKVYGLQFLGTERNSEQVKTHETIKLTQISKIPSEAKVYRVKMAFAKQGTKPFMTNMTFDDGQNQILALKMADTEITTQDILYVEPYQSIVGFRVAATIEGIHAIQFKIKCNSEFQQN